MWGTVLLMAVVAGADPARIGAVAYILTRHRPMRLLVAYFVGGFGMSLIVGAVIVFLLDGAGIGSGSSIPPEIEIAVGVLSLVVAALVATGVAARMRDRARSRHGTATPTDLPAAGGGGPSLERLPGYEKLPQRVQDALHSESPWIAWIAGVAVGMPTAYYLAAIAAILKSGVGTRTQVGALLVFNVIAFAVAEIPLVSFALAPEATRTRLEQLYTWVSDHQRLVISVVAALVGIYLVAIGISKL